MKDASTLGSITFILTIILLAAIWKMSKAIGIDFSILTTATINSIIALFVTGVIFYFVTSLRPVTALICLIFIIFQTFPILNNVCFNETAYVAPAELTYGNFSPISSESDACWYSSTIFKTILIIIPIGGYFLYWFKSNKY